MARLGDNRWGKSEVRVSKIHRGETVDDFSDVTVRVLLEGDVDAAHIRGDNSSVLPTDTMKNTVYGLAQDHLSEDLEAFGSILCRHFLEPGQVRKASVSISARRWSRHSATGFVGGGSELRLADVVGGAEESVAAGIEGLVVLKTRGSAFSGFPKDRFTTLPEADERLLATSVTATWAYSEVPEDTTGAWGRVREAIVDRFFSAWSASVQHQGYLMAEAALDAVAEISQISFHLPNQHHLAVDLTRFDMPDHGTVFQPVAQPYGDIAFTVHRD